MRLIAVATVGLLGLLAACGGRPLETEIERHPANVLPMGASQVLFAHVGRLQDNPLAVFAYERLQRLDLGPSLTGTSQTLRLAGNVERLALATYGATTAKDAAVLAVAIGRFSEDTFRKALETLGIPYVEGNHSNYRFYTCGRGETRCYVSFASAQLLVVSSQEDLLKKTLDLSRRKAKSMARDRGFAPLLATYSPHLDFWVTGAFPGAIATAFAGQTQAVVQMIQAFTITVSGGDSKRLELTLHCIQPEAAEANGMVLKTVVSGIIQELALSGYRIADLVDAVKRSKIHVEGSVIHYALEMNKSEMAATAAALQAEPAPPAARTFPRPPARDFRSRDELTEDDVRVMNGGRR